MPAVFRVAIVLSELRPGGMERVVVHLANGLGDRGIATMVVCLGDAGELARELKRPAVTFKALQSHTGWDFKAWWRLTRSLRQFRPTVINLHDYASLPYTAVANLFSRNAPLLYTAHGLLYEGFEKLRPRYRLFARFLDSVSAVSEEVASRHREYLNWHDPILIIPNGVPDIETDDLLRQSIRAELGCDEDEILFLAVGNPRPEKGFEDLIEAVRLLAMEGDGRSRWKVAIAGKLTGSPYCRMLSDQVQKFNLTQRCRLLGFREDTRALYSAADAFILSSRSEGLPMVILEAMTAGLPAIATRVGGVADAVAGGGLLVGPARPDEIASAMKLLCSDRDLCATLGSVARRLSLEKFGVDVMVDSYANWYMHVARPPIHH